MTAPTLLFHMSDIHFGLEDRVALAWAKGEIARRRPAAVAITGDLTMRARHKEFAAASKWIRSLDAPVTVEVGNHDMPYFNLVERFLTPYRRFRAIEELVEREIDLPGLAIVPLKTAARAQMRLNWSKGCVTERALAECVAAIDTLPKDMKVVVASHHPLVEVGTRGTALTKRGERALRELAKRKVVAVLSGHVHDAFDLMHETSEGPIRMIGAGTLSKRLRSTPPSFNALTWHKGELTVEVCNLEHMATPEMMIDDVPEDASRHEGEPVAAASRVVAQDSDSQ